MPTCTIASSVATLILCSLSSGRNVCFHPASIYITFRCTARLLFILQRKGALVQKKTLGLTRSCNAQESQQKMKMCRQAFQELWALWCLLFGQRTHFPIDKYQNKKEKIEAAGSREPGLFHAGCMPELLRDHS